MFLCTQRAPFAVFSVLSYNKKREMGIARSQREEAEARKRHTSSGKVDGSTEILLLAGVDPIPEEEVSFAAFLVPAARYRPRHHMSGEPQFEFDSTTITPQLRKISDSDGDGDFEGFVYEPSILDNPEMIAGKYRTTLRFCSYLVSVINYVRPIELKTDLNEKFAQQFPMLGITLSKLRSLKKDMKRIAQDCDIDIFTISQAYVYFEKLILLRYLNKANRKHIAGTCLLLSSKINDCKGEQMTILLEAIEDRFKIAKKELFSYEFPILVALKFELHLSEVDIYSHYQRLLYES